MKCSSILALGASYHHQSYRLAMRSIFSNTNFRTLLFPSSSQSKISSCSFNYNAQNYGFPMSYFVKNKSERRTFSTAPALRAEMIDVTFVTTDGKKHQTKGKIGDNLLDVVVNNNIDLDGFGACEGTLACSTCHLVFEQRDFDKINDKITDEELDMLDLAYGLTETSRLGCQVTLTKSLDGVVVKVPAGVNDARS